MRRSQCAVLVAVVLVGCDPSAKDVPVTPGGDVVARYEGGVVTRDELAREANRLPPELREQFRRLSGQKELALSIVDKRLLVAEARRRKLTEDPEIQREVRALEERLIVQRLLADEERAAAPSTDEELRELYRAHREDFEQPEGVRVRRILVHSPKDAPSADRQRARKKAEAFRARLRRGEDAAKVAREGQGAEAVRGGDLGWITKDGSARRMADAAFKLNTAQPISDVVDLDEGFAVLALIERRAARTPPFEEVRSAVEARMLPMQQRRVFDRLRQSLRESAAVKLEFTARP